MALNRNMNKTFPLHNKLLFCVCAKYGPAKSSSDFRIGLSPKQFISNQRPFSSFRAYRRSFKCNLVFGGFSYLPSAASAPGQPRQFQRYFQSIVFFPCRFEYLCICSNNIFCDISQTPGTMQSLWYLFS